MTWLLLAAFGLAIVYRVGSWLRRDRPRSTRWRITIGGFAVGLLIAAAFLAMRDDWLFAIALATLGLVLALSTRWPRRTGRPG